MMIFFFMMGALIDKYKPAYGHQTCLTIILGATISLIGWGIAPKDSKTVF
jgi:hypothetical protein